MKRDIYKQLLSWKQSSSRKPLVLKGARQVGKLISLKNLGKESMTVLRTLILKRTLI